MEEVLLAHYDIPQSIAFAVKSLSSLSDGR